VPQNGGCVAGIFRRNLVNRHVARYRIEIEYDGAPFAGWQRQQGPATVQSALEDALTTVLRQPVTVTGSGRTDAGVHATGQVAHFDGPAGADPRSLLRSVNGVLAHRQRGAIVLLDVREASADFHARYDARQRVYHYRASGAPRALERHHRWEIRPEPDWDRMNRAAEALLGTHHFGSFCITRSETQNRVCTVEHAAWEPEARPHDWRFVIAGDRFLHGMVRAIVGTLVQVGHGSRQPGEIAEILAARDRTRAGPAAPAHGLALVAVRY
jgi:tRNA pseudouridine38-40 synthase